MATLSFSSSSLVQPSISQGVVMPSSWLVMPTERADTENRAFSSLRIVAISIQSAGRMFCPDWLARSPSGASTRCVRDQKPPVSNSCRHRSA